MMKFSVVITYYPEDKTPEVLESIEKLDYSKEEYEILDLPGKGSPSIYRNKGGDNGKGEIIAFIDDDAIVHPKLLQNAEKFFNEHPEIDIVGGPQLTPKDEKGFARISGYALSSKFGGWNTSSRYERKKLNLDADDIYLTTAIMFCKKNVFKKVRFDENLFPGEDSKFVREAREKGLKVAYSPDLIVYHRRRPTIKKFVKQIFSYGEMAPAQETASEILSRPYFLFPSILLIYLTVLLSGIIINSQLLTYMHGILRNDFTFPSLIFLPLLIYLTLNLIFSVYESLRNKDLRGILFLPAIFPLLHLSYGAGMIYGLLKGE